MFGQPARTTFLSLFKHHNDVTTPAEYVTKMKQRLSALHTVIKRNQDLASKLYYDKKSTDSEFQVGARVWLNNPAHKVGLNDKMKPKVTGPWIVKKKAKLNYVIENEQGEKQQTVHRNRLRTCHSPSIREEAAPDVTGTKSEPAPQPITTHDDTGDDDNLIWLWQQQPTVALPPAEPTKRRASVTDQEPADDSTISTPASDNSVVPPDSEASNDDHTNRSVNGKNDTGNTDNFIDALDRDSEDEIGDDDNNDHDNASDNDELLEVFEDEQNLTYQDNEATDPNYKPGKRRTSSPYPFEQSEGRRYPNREHKRPARYTVNAIRVIKDSNTTAGQINKSVRFDISNIQFEKQSKPIRESFRKSKSSLYTVLTMIFCLCLINNAHATSEIVPVGSDLGKLIGPINLCSATRPHDATFIDMDPIYDCTVNDPRHYQVQKLYVSPYFPRHFSNSFDIYSCSMEHSTVETFLSFFGGKSVNGRWTVFTPIPEVECRQHVSQIMEVKTKLTQIYYNVWSDKTTQVSVEYSYCCHAYNATQARLIIKKLEAVYNFNSLKLMSSNVNLESCVNLETMHCLVDGATIIWSETIKEKCGYTEGKKVTAEISSNGMMISEQGQFAVVMVKESTHCGKKLWETDQDMLIYKHPASIHNAVVNVTHPTKDLDMKLQHSTSSEGHLAYVAYQLESLTYELFKKSYLAICRLKYQRYQSMKYLMQNGNAMYVARMLMNSTAVTGYDAGTMLAVSRCLQINTYQYSINPRVGGACHSAVPIRYFHNAEWHYGNLQLVTKNILTLDLIGCSSEG